MRRESSSGFTGAVGGFFVKLRQLDHIVLLGIMEGESIALAYLNKNNFNIDYDIHVAKDYWHQRIGTRMLYKALRLALHMGSPIVSVVRVFRKVGGNLSDIRAVKLYSANKPTSKYSVFRLT